MEIYNMNKQRPRSGSAEWWVQAPGWQKFLVSWGLSPLLVLLVAIGIVWALLTLPAAIIDLGVKKTQEEERK